MTRDAVRASRVPWLAAVAGLTFTIQVYVSRTLYWDTYYDLTAGRYIATNGLPTHETLTVAGMDAWIDQQWLAHLLLYSAWTVGGYAAVALASTVAVTIAYVLLGWLLADRGVPESRMLFWTYAALLVALGGTVIRAQSLALPLAVLLAALIIRDARRASFEWPIVLAVPLLVAWANIHGSVLLGAALTAVYAGSRALLLATRRDIRSAAMYVLTAVLVTAAVLATPYGMSVLIYYDSLLGNTAVHRFIQEWAPPTLGDPYSVGYFAMLAATIAIGLYALARRYRPPTLLVVAALVLGVLSLTALRFGVWFAMAAALLNADILANTRSRPPSLPRRFVRLTAITLATTALASALVLVNLSREQFEGRLPTAAMTATDEYAALYPTSLILADETASALIWRQPALAGRVAFDARLEQYSSDALQSWFEFLSVLPPGWPAAADCYEVVLVSSARPQLLGALSSSSTWTLLAADATGAAYVRQPFPVVTGPQSATGQGALGSDPGRGSASGCAQPR